MTANRNPRADVRMVVAFSLATVACCFAAGWTVAGLVYDRLRR
jgi:hypothetical protein